MGSGSIKLHFISLEQIQKRNGLVTIELAKGYLRLKQKIPGLGKILARKKHFPNHFARSNLCAIDSY